MASIPKSICSVEYCIAGNFGGATIWRIDELWWIFNVANLWPHVIEHGYNDSKWLIFYFGE